MLVRVWFGLLSRLRHQPPCSRPPPAPHDHRRFPSTPSCNSVSCPLPSLPCHSSSTQLPGSLRIHTIAMLVLPLARLLRALTVLSPSTCSACHDAWRLSLRALWYLAGLSLTTPTCPVAAPLPTLLARETRRRRPSRRRLMIPWASCERTSQRSPSGERGWTSCKTRQVRARVACSERWRRRRRRGWLLRKCGHRLASVAV